MATESMIKAGGGASDFEQFGATDTIPAGNLPAKSVISPAQITADQDDYAPTGWADADVVRLDFAPALSRLTARNFPLFSPLEYFTTTLLFTLSATDEGEGTSPMLVVNVCVPSESVGIRK